MAKVSRLQVVQSCLNLYENPRYLEIGVCEGNTFLPMQAGEKVAVDPKFRPGVTDKIGALPSATAHEITSDAYFGKAADPSERFDVIYLDGLHTLEQTLRDLMNAVEFLTPTGIIIIDDVYPNSYHASLTDRRAYNAVRDNAGTPGRAWMGDVFRLTFFIDTFMQQWRYRMTSDNHGQLVIWRGRRENVTERGLEAVARAPFESVFLDDAAQRRMPLRNILREIGGDIGLTPARVAEALAAATPAPAQRAPVPTEDAA